jgi:hypothetical protein
VTFGAGGFVVRRPPAVGVELYVMVVVRGPKGREPFGPHCGGGVHLGSSSSGSSRGPAEEGVGRGAAVAGAPGALGLPGQPPVGLGGLLLLLGPPRDGAWLLFEPQPHCGSGDAVAVAERMKVKEISDCVGS